MIYRFQYLVILFAFSLQSCGANQSKGSSKQESRMAVSTQIIPGADQLNEYLPLLKGKKVGLMGNQTSVVGNEHLVDVLLENKVDIKFAFAPEHGFRGDIER